MLHVLDEKWKDHLYDLDQLRNAIHYRSWGQKDPLVEYKQEAYTMFVDLMSDLYNTFAERFLRAQIVIEQPQAVQSGRSATARMAAAVRACRRHRADAPLQRARHSRGYSARGRRHGVARRPGQPEGNVDIGPDEAPEAGGRRAEGRAHCRRRARLTSLAPQAAGNTDWSSVGRNDPCPCGSGKKFKKCHGATV